MISPDIFPDFLPGTVWLAGAGPGDPLLLTLLAHHGLECADIVVYDALVDERILAMANTTATLEYAGKRGGRPSVKQSDISQRLVALAQDGKRVMRLKGGDPFVFGRGAQECETLAAAGIDFRIVPGITAGIGGLAYAGIPVTSRDTNAAVTFVTGHTASGDVPDTLDWDCLSKGSPADFFVVGDNWADNDQHGWLQITFLQLRHAVSQRGRHRFLLRCRCFADQGDRFARWSARCHEPFADLRQMSASHVYHQNGRSF